MSARDELQKILEENGCHDVQGALAPIDWLFKVLEGEPWPLAKEAATYPKQVETSERLRELVKFVTNRYISEVVIFGEPLSLQAKRHLRPDYAYNSHGAGCDDTQQMEWLFKALTETNLFPKNQFEIFSHNYLIQQSLSRLEDEIAKLENGLTERIGQIVCQEREADAREIDSFCLWHPGNSGCFGSDNLAFCVGLPWQIWDNLQSSLFSYLGYCLLNDTKRAEIRRQLMTAWSQYLFVGFRLVDLYVLIVMCG